MNGMSEMAVAMRWNWNRSSGKRLQKSFSVSDRVIHHWNKNRGYDKNNSDGAVDSVAVCVYVQIQKYTKRF